MSTLGFHLFSTSIGTCAVAWSKAGITGVQLPEATKPATRKRMKERFPQAREADVSHAAKRAAQAIQRSLDGGSTDLSGIVLDMSGVPAFHRLVYKAARKVPAGTTRTYGEVAKQAGSPRSARAVGQALGRNPFAIVVPCHRVVAAGGKAGGFTAPGGTGTKARLLQIEGCGLPLAWSADESPSAKKQAGARRASTAATKTEAPTNPSTRSKQPALVSDGADLRRTLAGAVRALRKSDPALATLIDEVGPCRLEINQAQSVFDALARAIVFQQLTGRAASTIHGRVCALFSARKTRFTPQDILKADEDKLRGAGLSRAKAAALRDLATKVVARDIPTLAQVRKMDSDAIIEQLTTVRGVGRWTVEMLLIFRLGRLDVLPVDDYGVRKGFAFAYRKRDLPSPKALAQFGKKWAPWRSVASWYMWRAADAGGQRRKAK